MWPLNSPDLNPVDYATCCHAAACVWDQCCDSVYCMCGAAWSSRWLMMQLTNGQHALACLCSCQRRTFWTYFVTINLFSLYLITLFHTVFDAACDVLGVHYIGMKRDVSFSQGRVSTIFRWGGHFFTRVKNFFRLMTVQKLYTVKIDRDFPKLWSQMYCHIFMVHSVCK